MDAQLHLITSADGPTEGASTTWQLDGHTVATGRAGVALARAALRQATRRHPDEPGDERSAA